MKKKHMKLIGSIVLAFCLVVTGVVATIHAQAEGEETAGKDLYYSQEPVAYQADGNSLSGNGYLFAGWYEKTGDVYTAVKKPEAGESYYVKYVPEEMLGVKAQVSKNIFSSDGDVNKTAENAIRFVTSLDSTDYKDVGFEIYIGGAPQDTTSNKTNYVYRTLYAIGATEATKNTACQYTADEVFGNNASQFFKTYTFTDIPEVGFNTDIIARAYYTTYDGVTVYGTQVIRSVNFCRGWFYVDSSAYQTEAANVGTMNSPATLEKAIEIVEDTTLVTPKIHVTSDIEIEKQIDITSVATIIGVNDTTKDGDDKRVEISAADGMSSTNNAFINVAGGANLDINNIIIDASENAGFAAINVPAESATEVHLKDSTFNMNNKEAVYVGKSGNLTMTDENVTWSCQDQTKNYITNCEVHANQVYYLTLTDAWVDAKTNGGTTTITMTRDCTLDQRLHNTEKSGTCITFDGQNKYTLTTEVPAITPSGTSIRSGNVMNINPLKAEDKININFQNMNIVHKSERSLVGVNQKSYKTSVQVSLNNVEIDVLYDDSNKKLQFGLFNFRDDTTILMTDVRVTVNSPKSDADNGIIRTGNKNDGATVYARLQNCNLDTTLSPNVSIARNYSGNTLDITCQGSTLKTAGVYIFNTKTTDTTFGNLTATVDEFTAGAADMGETTTLDPQDVCKKNGPNYTAATSGASINGFLYADLQTAFTDAQLLDGYVTVKMLKDCKNWASTSNVSMKTNYVDITIDGQDQYKLTTGAVGGGQKAFSIEKSNISLKLQNMKLHHLSNSNIVSVSATPVEGVANGQKINVSLDDVDITTNSSTSHQYGLFNFRNNVEMLYMKDVSIDYQNSSATKLDDKYAIIRFGNAVGDDGTKIVNAVLEGCTMNVHGDHTLAFRVPNGTTATIETKDCKFVGFAQSLVGRGTSTNLTFKWWPNSTYNNGTVGDKWVNSVNCASGYTCKIEEVSDVVDVKWNNGQVVSELGGTAGSLKADNYHKYTDVIVIPKAGTEIRFIDDIVTSSTTYDSVLTKGKYAISSWKKVNGEYVFDANGANYSGAEMSASPVCFQNLSADKKTIVSLTYKYVTSRDNEAIRLCYEYTGAEETPVVYIKENAGVGTVQSHLDFIKASKEALKNTELEGKTLAVFGDSYLGGNLLRKEHNWVQMLADKYNMTLYNHAVGGSTVSNKVNKTPLVDRWDNDCGEPDIIIVEGGRNDSNSKFNIEMGTVDDTTTHTYLGALKYMVQNLRDKYPNAIIVGITPYNTEDRAATVEYANAMRDLFALYGLPCIYAADPEVSGVDVNDKQFRIDYMEQPTDYSHLNYEGHKKVLPYFENAIVDCYNRVLNNEFDEKVGEMPKIEYLATPAE